MTSAHRGNVNEIRSSGHPLNLACFQALGAHADANVLAVNRGTHGLQVWTKGSLRADVRMRNGVTGLRTLATYCATSCHHGLPYSSIPSIKTYIRARPQSRRGQNTQLHKNTTESLFLQPRRVGKTLRSPDYSPVVHAAGHHLTTQ